MVEMVVGFATAILSVPLGEDRTIDVQLAPSGRGENYGWNVMEGAHCYNAQSCNETGLVSPVAEYSNGEDARGELYVVSFGGSVCRIVP